MADGPARRRAVRGAARTGCARRSPTTEQVRRPVAAGAVRRPATGRRRRVRTVRAGPRRRSAGCRAGPERPAWRRVAARRAGGRRVRRDPGLGLWTVFLTSERDEAVGDRGGAGGDRGRAAPARPGGDRARGRADGRTVATVVARTTGCRWSPTACRSTTRRASTYVVWGMRRRTCRSPSGTFDVVTIKMDLRPVGSDGDRPRRLQRVRHQHRARSAGSVGPDGGRRDRGGDQLSEQETVARRRSRRTGRPPASGGHGTTPTRCTACASGSPRPAGGGGSPRAAASTTPTAWAWASSAA